jgi:hypothetical protein
MAKDVFSDMEHLHGKDNADTARSVTGVGKAGRAIPWGSPDASGPNLKKAATKSSPAEINDRIDNEQAGTWRRGVDDDADY